MRTIIVFASVAFTSAVIAGSAAAEDRIHLTPPLYRELARATQQVRPAAELSTTPQPVHAVEAPRPVTILGTAIVTTASR